VRVGHRHVRSRAVVERFELETAGAALRSIELDAYRDFRSAVRERDAIRAAREFRAERSRRNQREKTNHSSHFPLLSESRRWLARQRVVVRWGRGVIEATRGVSAVFLTPDGVVTSTDATVY